MGTEERELRPGPAQKDGQYPHWDLSQKVIGAAFEVHRELGSGFLENVYQVALERELKALRLDVEIEAPVPVNYKGQPVGLYYADVLVDRKVICEIKAVQSLTPAHEAQLLHYLKATGVKLGLLMNFGAQSLQFKRLVRTK